VAVGLAQGLQEWVSHIMMFLNNGGGLMNSV